MKKRLVSVLLPFFAILLELLPYGAVLVFAPSPSERIRETVSYFSLTSLGYGNFGPLITAILSCLILAVAICNMIKQSKRTSNVLFVLSILALITSLLPLLFGFGFYSITGALISAALALEVWIARTIAKAN